MKQSPRSNSLVYSLERTHRQLKLLLQSSLRASGIKISVDQWIVLNEINNRPGQPNHALASSTAKDPASITRIISLLQKKKLVRKTAMKNDKRLTCAELLPAGKKKLAECNKALEDFRAKAAKGLSQSDLNTLKNLLDILFENSGGRLISLPFS